MLLVLSGWWWVAPAAAGVGAATYAGLTMKGRRARRLALDAARHQEAGAYRTLVQTRAATRTARAEHRAERSRSGMMSSQTLEAKRELQRAKRAHTSATLELRAQRARVKAAAEQYSTSSRADPLPVEKLHAAHDEVIARWLPYEVDAEKVLSYPGMTDPRHPATLAFLRAQREAQRLRPAAGGRVSPPQFIEYQAAVRTLEETFAEAERRHGDGLSRTAVRRP